MATTTTTGAGDWNTGGNWDNGVPTVADDAVISHAMTIDGTGATFLTLDNNSTLTLTANQTWTIAGAGSIDNAGGTITCSANNPDVTFTSSNTTKWTWQINSGIWTDGTGTHTFEYGDLSVNSSYSLLNSGTYVFNEAMTFQGLTAGDRIIFYVPVTFAAGKTYIIGDGTNVFNLQFTDDLTMEGTNGSHITVDGNSQTGYLSISPGAGNTFSVDYVDFSDFYITIYSTACTATSTWTVNHTTITNTLYDGILIVPSANGATYTISNTDIYSNSRDGFYCSDAHGVTVTLTNCNIYSNTSENVNHQINHADSSFTFTRCKIYSGTTYGAFQSDSTPLGVSAFVSCLFYENSYDILTYGGIAGTKIFNCTFADSTTDNIYTLLPSGKVCPITNCIVADGGRYGINAGGTDDPVVTYTDCTGNTTADYNGMADPTGANGNIDADPKFTDAAGDDYDIGGGSSPCINTGTSTGAPANDIDDVAWPNAAPEMGCYGELESASASGPGVAGALLTTVGGG